MMQFRLCRYSLVAKEFTAPASVNPLHMLPVLQNHQVFHANRSSYNHREKKGETSCQLFDVVNPDRCYLAWNRFFLFLVHIFNSFFFKRKRSKVQFFNSMGQILMKFFCLFKRMFHRSIYHNLHRQWPHRRRHWSWHYRPTVVHHVISRGSIDQQVMIVDWWCIDDDFGAGQSPTRKCCSNLATLFEIIT